MDHDDKDERSENNQSTNQPDEPSSIKRSADDEDEDKPKVKVESVIRSESDYDLKWPQEKHNLSDREKKKIHNQLASSNLKSP